MKYLSYILNVVLVVAIIAILNKCHCPECNEIVGSTKTSKIDTLKPDNKLTKRSYKPKPKQIIEHIGISDTICPENKTYIYQDSLIDSNVSIYVIDTTSGEILAKEISYKLHVPLRIKETITITNTIEKEVPQRALYIGAEIGSNFITKFRIAPEVEYLDKKGNAFSYNYDLLNQIHSAGFKKRIF